MDLSGQYKASTNVTRALRHVAHFKKTGTTEYVIDYVDMATSSGISKSIYLHYNMNGVAYPGGVTRSTTTITSNQTTAGITSTALAPSGQTAYVNETSWSGPAAYGVKVCAATGGAPSTCDASNLAAEFIAVHTMTAAPPATMGTLSQPSETNFRVVQVSDSGGSKVAAFGKAGASYASANFTTTHSGTAQYLIAGLSAGPYSVTVNGISVASCTVNAGDNTCYFESTAGTVLVSTGTSACDLNGDGTVNVQDTQLAVNMSLSLIPCTANINGPGVCNSVTISRVVTASLGGACVVGP